MANPLTAEQAYLAGREDCRVATARAHKVIDSGGGSMEDVLLDTLSELWARRIVRGELPPLTEAQVN